MTRLYYCNTCYYAKPPVDINPLILERYKKGKVLVLCSRESMVKRIRKMLDKDYTRYPHLTLRIYGLWELEEAGLTQLGIINKNELFSWDAVVVIGKNRADERFQLLLKHIDKTLSCGLSPLTI